MSARSTLLVGLAGLVGLCLCGNTDSMAASQDVSGLPMQRFESRMMGSPLQRMPTLLGVAPWPVMAYGPPTSVTVVQIQITVVQPIEPRPALPALEPTVWTQRCGTFVKIEIGSKSNLMEEERKPC